jgi:hypothetical protein
MFGNPATPVDLEGAPLCGHRTEAAIFAAT